ncbi:MAG: hypothetical protein ACXQS8_03645, partial [Candidatus Helarchaeales archaeon]
ENDEAFLSLSSDRKSSLISNNLIEIKNKELHLTSLSKSILESYHVLDLYYYFSDEFEEDVLSS